MTEEEDELLAQATTAQEQGEILMVELSALGWLRHQARRFVVMSSMAGLSWTEWMMFAQFQFHMSSTDPQISATRFEHS